MTEQKAEKKEKSLEEYANAFNNWKAKKDSTLLRLYQEKYSGKGNEETDQKITKIENEISQGESRTYRSIARLIARTKKAGSSTDAKETRRERTHHLCKLGGLVEKAGLGHLESPVLLGMLLQQAEYLKSNPTIKNRWDERGKAAMNEEIKE